MYFLDIIVLCVTYLAVSQHIAFMSEVWKLFHNKRETCDQPVKSARPEPSSTTHCNPGIRPGLAGIGNAIELNFGHAVGAFLVGQSVQSATFPLSPICRKWAKILSVLNAFRYKTEKGISWNSVPLMFLEHCTPYIRGLCGFCYTDSYIFKMLSDCPVKVSRLYLERIPVTWGTERLVFGLPPLQDKDHLFTFTILGAMVPAVILSIINSMYTNSNNKWWKLMETKDGNLQ